MEARELRIGNYVAEKGVFKVVHSVSNHNAKDYSKITPIPLTEEWLLKFGFNADLGQATKVLNDSFSFCVMYDDGDEFPFLITEVLSEYEDDHSVFAPKNLKYVHQLQNLYFALTGEELTIKN